jgi:hypothetical protein
MPAFSVADIYMYGKYRYTVVYIENTEVSTFLLLMFVPFFILLDYYGRSLQIRIMWFDNISVIFLQGCLESSG